MKIKIKQYAVSVVSGLNSPVEMAYNANIRCVQGKANNTAVIIFDEEETVAHNYRHFIFYKEGDILDNVNNKLTYVASVEMPDKNVFLMYECHNYKY